MPENAEAEMIYMPLENEGTECWMPVRAIPLGAGCFRILGPMGEQDEEWRFPPGSIVIARLKRFSGGEEHLTAMERAPSS
jgi:hypothetical protein